MRPDIKTMQPTALNGSNAKCYYAKARAFNATRPTNDASNSLGDSNYFESPRHSDVSDVSQANETSPDLLRFEASSSLARSKGNQRSARNKRESYTVPTPEKSLRKKIVMR